MEQGLPPTQPLSSVASRPRAGEDLARAMGVSIRERDLGPTLRGLTLGREDIVVSSRLSAPERDFTIAHELGHVAVRRGDYRPSSRQDEEYFADSFACRILGIARGR